MGALWRLALLRTTPDQRAVPGSETARMLVPTPDEAGRYGAVTAHVPFV